MTSYTQHPTNIIITSKILVTVVITQSLVIPFQCFYRGKLRQLVVCFVNSIIVAKIILPSYEVAVKSPSDISPTAVVAFLRLDAFFTFCRSLSLIAYSLSSCFYIQVPVHSRFSDISTVISDVFLSGNVDLLSSTRIIK